MCGIVGLFLKDPALEPDLGKHLSIMLETMTARGPDSAGFAVYGEGEKGRTKITLRAPADFEDYRGFGEGAGVGRESHAARQPYRRHRADERCSKPSCRRSRRPRRR